VAVKGSAEVAGSRSRYFARLVTILRSFCLGYRHEAVGGKNEEFARGNPDD